MTGGITFKRSPSPALGSAIDVNRQVAILRIAWVILTVASIALFFRAIPVFYDQVRTPCAVPDCLPWQPRDHTPATRPTLAFYAVFGIVRDGVFFIVFCILATLLALRGKNDRMALLTACFLVAFAGGAYPDTVIALWSTGGFWQWSVAALGFTGSMGLVLFFCLFPNGQFTPAWTTWVAMIAVVINVIGYVTPLSFVFNSYGEPFSLALFGLLAALAVGQWTRYRTVSTLAERQQTKWVVFGFGVSFIGFFITLLILPMIGPDLIPNRAMFRLVGMTIASSFLLLIPISIAFGVLRFRLWEIDLWINRALIYVVLTVLVVGVYVSSVALLTALLPSSGDTIASLIVTGFLAVLFQPLRFRLQRGANRLVFGERDDPYRVLSRLGERLGATLDQGAVLPVIVETVVQSLRVPFAAITLMHQNPSNAITVSHGRLGGEVVVWPLLYQQERMGELHVAVRGPGEQFSSSDRRLLDNLAHQAGAAIHSVRLGSELQRSREQLVSSREEERRRLRRDLHDGLGPQLASQTLTLDAARKMMLIDPAAADHLLDELRGHIQSSVTDIRRLVYALRPPALDELGFAGAIGETIRRYDGSGTNFRIQCGDSLHSLPAAVEVAGLRIVQEALTNVVKHAHANHCQIAIAIEDSPPMLRLTVEDDGTGLLPDRELGMGLVSMRERAMELGGRCEIESIAAGGTRVAVLLPIKEQA